MRTSHFPHGLVLEGELRGQGDVVIAGVVEGPIAIEGVVTIEKTGVIRGGVRARALVLRGVIEGNVQADEVVRVEEGGRLAGDVVAERVSLALGALVRGRVRMLGAERMQRTTGGTLMAPFSSAGSVSSPSFPGNLRAPAIEAEPVKTEARGPRERPSKRQREEPESEKRDTVEIKLKSNPPAQAPLNPATPRQGLLMPRLGRVVSPLRSREP